MFYIDIIKEDCSILLNRALLDQKIVTFGEDGCGIYGKNIIPQYYIINALEIEINEIDNKFYGEVFIYLADYNSNIFGHICSDKNFEISIRKLFLSNFINPNIIQYSSIEHQFNHGVSMKFDPKQLCY